MITALDVAKYFLSHVDENAGDLISNLKLQKLLYFAQGFHLAIYDKPLFNDAIEAWMHGPVVPTVYRQYKKYGSEAIPRPNKIDFSIYNKSTKKFLDEVYKVYGQFSAWVLRNITHKQSPWLDAKDENAVISHKALRAFFKTEV